nr:response regulator [Lutispora saccharofermentans]
MRVLVVDDEKPCLDELVYILSGQENIEIVGAFTSPREALQASATLNPGVAFIDLIMPNLNGAKLATELLERNPALKIVFVTAYRKELARIRNSPAVFSLLKPISRLKLQEFLRRLPD